MNDKPMASNIRALPAPAANPLVVDFVRDLLKRAEAGEFNFVAIVATTHDGCVVDGYTRSETVRPYTVIGGLEALKLQFAARSIEGLL